MRIGGTGWILRALLVPGVASAIEATSRASEDTNAPIEVKVVHPEQLASALIALFDGARAPHPAAALSRWKRASVEPGRLGKPLEAIISVFNPEMAPEWKCVDGSTLSAGLDPSRGSVRWRLNIPHDDGSIAALLTAMRLSGGADEAPVGEHQLPVERLGNGTPVATRGGEGLVIASSREELDRAHGDGGATQLLRGEGAGGAITSGLYFRIEPAKLPDPEHGSDATRRVVALAKGLGCRTLGGSLAVRGDAIGLEVTCKLEAPNPTERAAGIRTIDPAWLGFVPDDAAAVLCLATGGGPGYWDALFRLADRVDRAPAARAGMAPLRTRLAFLTTASGARVEADLWPHLKGLTLVVLADRSATPRLGLALHMDAPASARVVVEETLPRLATLWGGGRKKAVAAADPAVAAPLGQIGGRRLEASSSGATVFIGWGDGALSTLRPSAERAPKGLIARIDREAAREADRLWPDRFGYVHPGRFRLPFEGLDGPSPLAESLAEGPPLIWAGWTRGEDLFDRVEWADLKPMVRRFLDRIPLAPATR